MVDACVDTERWFYSRFKLTGGSLPFLVIARPDGEKLAESHGYLEEPALTQLLAHAKLKAQGLSPPATDPRFTSQAVENPAETPTAAELQAVRAAKAHKLVALRLLRTGCVQCEHTLRQWPAENVPEADAFVTIDVDVDGPDLARVAALYVIAGGALPILVLARPDKLHTVLARSYGYITPSRLTAFLRGVARGHLPALFTNKTANVMEYASTVSQEGWAGKGPNATMDKAQLLLASGTVEESLAAHNELRARHGAPPLGWSLKCQQSAQAWADRLAQTGKLEHGGHEGCGQNLAYCRGELTSAQAVLLWYQELATPGYSFDRPRFSHATGHFTQVVWRSSRRLGVGVAQGRTGTYVVAHYEPPGNLTGQFQQV